jgi:hypothetical protein
MNEYCFACPRHLFDESHMQDLMMVVCVGHFGEL